MRRGQTLQVRLILGDPSETLLLDTGAFLQDTGGTWAFVIGASGKDAIRRAVRTGRRNTRYVEVLEGLRAGEQVITSSYTAFLEMDRLELDADVNRR